MDNKPKIDGTNPLYSAQQKKREDFHAVKGGTDSIRAGGERYLPLYAGETAKEHKQRVNQSTIDGLVMMGVDTLCGKVFEEEIDTSKVNQSLALFLENFDNEGTHFNNFWRCAFEHSFDGFSLVLTDGPPETPELAEAKATLGAEADKKYNLRPYARIYTAANVLDWYYTTNPLTRIKELTFLKLKEVEDILTDTLEHAEIVRYRLLRLTGGVVTWELYEEKEGKNKEKEFVLVGSGTIDRVTQIPVRTIGCFTDDPKLLNESRIEIKTYQKESSFDVCEYHQIPTLWTKGYDVETHGPLKVGASAHIELPADENAGVGYLQIDASGHETLKGTIGENKATIKARLSQLEDVSVEKTATETVVNSKDKDARLVVWADELKDAIEGTLQFMAQMMGLGEDAGGEITLRTSWVVQQEKAELRDQQQHEQTLEVKKAAMKS